MATLPPKRTTTPTKTSKQQITPLQTLLQMGIPKHRAEKALAATGTTDAQLATDWLLAHVNDPLIDDNSPRDYILYACPTGKFLQQLQNYWEQTKKECGWNGAHNFIPHITLASFFKAPDENVFHLIQGLQTVMGKHGAMLNEPLKLEAYTSPNFMGFFVAEDHADYLKRIAMQFVKEVSNAIISDTYEHFDALTACFPWCTTTTARCIPRGSRSISLEPHVKSLHLTLAYQFPSTHYNHLKSLVDQLDPNESAGWELRLYSRDSHLNGKQVYKVIHSYSPNECDELELRIGDFIYLNSEILANNSEGWVEGTSWLTGLTGLLPASFVARTAESDAWTLHKKIEFVETEKMDTEEGQGSNKSVKVEKEITLPAIVDIYGEALKSTNVDSVNEFLTEDGKQPRRLFILRHGERVDFTFGTWIPHCFDDTGKYTPRDLNMPATMPTRSKGPSAYALDTPLTNVGMFQARTIGEGLSSKNVSIDYAYCSPSFRCIQTCDSLLKGCGRNDMKIRLEPGLFEWPFWYSTIGMPDWMTGEELVAAGFNIDLDYQPFVTEKEIRETTETCEQFYLRNAFVARGALNLHSDGNVLLVGHSSTLDVCSRELIGKSPRTQNEMIQLIQKLPYCSMLHLVQIGDKWQIAESPVPPVTHSINPRFDYKAFLN